MPSGRLYNPARAVQAGHGRAGIQTRRHRASTHSLALTPGHHSTRLYGHLRTVKGSPCGRGGSRGRGRQAPHADQGRHAHGSLRAPAPRHTCWDTHVHKHARKAVPVTSFLGDSAQLDSHTSKSPREQEEAGEKTVRQAGGPPNRGCRHWRFRAPWAEGGGGEGMISWPGMTAGRRPE